MMLGRTTDTQDISGQILTEKAVNVDEREVRDAAVSFVCDYMQIPPMYSAIKVDGKKLYELARAGQEVERKARHVVINALNITEIQLPYVTMEVSCSKGTYIQYTVSGYWRETGLWCLHDGTCPFKSGGI